MSARQLVQEGNPGKRKEYALIPEGAKPLPGGKEITLTTANLLALKNLEKDKLIIGKILFNYSASPAQREEFLDLLEKPGVVDGAGFPKDLVRGIILQDNLIPGETVTVLSSGIIIGSLPTLTFIENFFNIIL